MIDLSRVRRDAFNLIVSGCGAGKSFFVTNHLKEYYPDVLPEEIMIITSRALTADQQARTDGVTKFKGDDMGIVNFWNGDPRGADIVLGTDSRIMTYDKFVYILNNCNTPGYTTLRNTKIIVFDECHSLFSDTFIRDIGMARLWVQERLLDQSKIIFGLTATPEILFSEAKQWGVLINDLIGEPLMRYKAKQMICTSFCALPRLVNSGRLPGKTLIMCNTLSECEDLQSKIPNSAIMVSQNRNEFTDEMAYIRTYISQHAKFPDQHYVVGKSKKEKNTGRWEPLDVLVTTTTAREGYNLVEESGVRNIVSCIGDDLHIIQVAGRARYDLDNIVVAYNPSFKGGGDTLNYFKKQRQEFSEFMCDGTGGEQWFSRVAHIVRHDYSGLKVIDPVSDVDAFKEYLDTKWVVPDTKAADWKKYAIFKNEDKQEIIHKCVEFKVSSRPNSRITFNHVIELITELGYKITSGRLRDEGTQYTYKLLRKAV